MSVEKIENADVQRKENPNVDNHRDTTHPNRTSHTTHINRLTKGEQT